ncbi:MAG: virulence-associated E family protein, partial [Candidatus Omnitrophota bacterium]
WYDEFYSRYFTKQNGVNREWTDVDDILLAAEFQRAFGIRRMSDEVISKAVRAYAAGHVRNEPREWMDSLVWDGTPRIDHFFPAYMGAEETEYTLAVSRNFWLGLAARIYKPGCQLDNMLILKGPQGSFKSTSLRIIGGQWYAEAQESVLTKDFYQILQGKLIIEIGELDTFDRAEVNTIKRVVSAPTDRYRASYGRAARDYPRQCVFVGTTNEDQVLRDHTGGRRFWPVDCGSINPQAIKTDRDQLFAEAVARIKAGEEWHIVPVEATKAVQEANRQSDEWEDVLRDYLARNTPPYTVVEIAEGCFGIKTDKLDKATQMRLGRCLRVLGYNKKLSMVNGKVCRNWVFCKPEQVEIEEF